MSGVVRRLEEIVEADSVERDMEPVVRVEAERVETVPELAKRVDPDRVE